MCFYFGFEAITLHLPKCSSWKLIVCAEISLTTGNPKDAGILPRALDVLFNSIHGKQLDNESLKPHMFNDVQKLSPEQQQVNAKVKEAVLKLADTEVGPYVSSV